MRYRFAGCDLDVDRHVFRAAGQPVPLEPQVFDLLVLLAQNPGRLITRDELVASVWHGQIVGESTITARISAARKAVGDSGERQSVIATVPRRGIKLVAEVEIIEGAVVPPVNEAVVAPSKMRSQPQRQRIQFCGSRDGTRIAFASHGVGYPLVRAGHWLTHLEHDWSSPIWRPHLDELARSFAVTRYDQRGNGLSDWEASEFTLDRFVEDLEAVVDKAGLGRFALYGMSQGAPVAVAYAARHPDRVTHLVLHGGYLQGRAIRGDEHERERGKALLTLIRHGWGDPDGPFVQAFAALMVPDGTREQIQYLTALQRMTTTPENAAALRAAFDGFEVTHLVPAVEAPTLVLHARSDGVQPRDEGRKLAAGIKDAEFVMLESRNHVILPHEPAFEVVHAELRRFVRT